jgi:hypothetical protein
VIVTASFLALSAAVAVTALVLPRGQVAGSGPRTVSARSQSAQVAPAGFGWFRVRSAPGGWAHAGLTGRQAVLSYPSSLRSMASDRGTVAVGLTSPSGAILVYLNVTPRQGPETLQGWPAFRLSHLRAEGQTAVRLDATSATLPFRSGQGRCVVDDYITRIAGNHYREIACFVQGTRAASVLIAATPAATWARYGGLLERVVNGYAVN